MQISKATASNWQRLNTDSTERLTKRANKTRSAKKVVATRYLNCDAANRLLNLVADLEAPVEDIIFTLCADCLQQAGIAQRANVGRFLSQQPYRKLPIILPPGIWQTHDDLLGFVYQSLITEGERNATGQYYTQKKVVDDMLAGLTLQPHDTLFDPCCGSGAFLMRVPTEHPEQLYGMDINPMAVLIATTNLLTKYADRDFMPHIYCQDFLAHGLFDDDTSNFPRKFTYIYTNPPWGADKAGRYKNDFPEITSKEKASMFIVEALRHLQPSGTLCFLLPSSLLKIKVHADVRRHILRHAVIEHLEAYNDRFDGVFTDFFSIRLTPSPMLRPVVDTETPFMTLSDMDQQIIEQMEQQRHDDLRHSRWALGIVTGNNKALLKSEPSADTEPIFTGKQVDAFRLKPAASHIVFQPATFQQCAKEEFYRAPEKLIYRFIAKYPVVAYDDRQQLCLNSANILIPQVDGLSVRSVAALLNSSLYRFYYQTRFSDLKVLKGNLQALPFPLLTAQQDQALSHLAQEATAVAAPDVHDRLDRLVYSIFGFGHEMQQYIAHKLT